MQQEEQIIRTEYSELMQKSYPGKKQMQIIGLAKGYAEALELVRSIIEEVYQNTGDVDVKSYLQIGRASCRERV